MKERFNVKKYGIILFVVILTIISAFLLKSLLTPDKEVEKPKEENNQDNYNLVGNFNVDIIKKFHEQSNDNNYLISPYNIEIALNMVREGSVGKTKEELDKVLGNRVIKKIDSGSELSVANGTFIKEMYKDSVKEEFYNTIKDKYDSEIIYDEFSKPDKINDWVNEKTNGMIKKILDEITPNFVMGLASALTIDVKWYDQFNCNNTVEDEFTKQNNEIINVEMMNQTLESSNYKYIKNDDYEGVVLPYRREEDSNAQFEFIAILPKDIDKFIKNMSLNTLDNIDNDARVAGESLHIKLSLPRFTYDYEPESFIKILKNLGIKEAFDPDNANFRNMIELSDNVFISTAAHKTHIELNEKGTKAAAVTFFGFDTKSALMPDNYEEVKVKFDKPFVYMIREANTKEILFFGTIYEPNIWNGSTCGEE